MSIAISSNNVKYKGMYCREREIYEHRTLFSNYNLLDTRSELKQIMYSRTGYSALRLR